MHFKNSIPPLLLTLATGLFSHVILAATQGNEGATSIGSLNLIVGVGDKVRISGLSDISGTFNGTNDIVGNSAACIYRNGTGNYSIRAEGSGQNGSFVIASGSTTVPYQVSFNDGSGLVAMSSGVDLIGRTGADRFSPSCATNGNTASVAVTIAATDLAQVPGANYSGTLTLVVAPE